MQEMCLQSYTVTFRKLSLLVKEFVIHQDTGRHEGVQFCSSWGQNRADNFSVECVGSFARTCLGQLDDPSFEK